MALIEDVSYECISQYTKYVSSNRVLPGLDLKPIHRRLLWAMMKMSARYGSGTFRKSSSICGTAMLYHPHGGGYQSLVTLVNQPNSLVEGRGNWGNVYGHPAAAERYTEAKTSERFEHLLDPYFMNVGKFIKNYDESDIEPVTFETKVPLILLTGVSGIGVGFSTNFPAFHISTVCDIVKSGVDDLSTYLNDDTHKGDIYYPYGASLYENSLFPTVSLKTISGKQYINITDIPKGSGVGILKSQLISDLILSENIEIIDNSKIDKIDILVYAPQDIQMMILKSISRPVIKSLSYYWNRYRTTDFMKNWIQNHMLYIRDREYYIVAKEWNKSISDLVVSNIASYIKKNPTTAIDDIIKIIESESTDLYNKSIETVPEQARKHVYSESDLISKIKAKPITTLREYPEVALPTINSLNDSDILNIIYTEVDSVDQSLFSKKSVSISKIPVAKFSSDIKRYVAMKNGEVLISYTKISRVVNHVVGIGEHLSIVYSDGTSEDVQKYYTGTYSSTDKKIVGYSIYGRPTVFHTESNNVFVLFKHGYLKEPLYSAFPAEEIEVDGTSYKVTSGLKFSSITSYKIVK